MKCAWCGQQRPRKDWFTPQWNSERPQVSHSSGDYDRCKVCYNGPAPDAPPPPPPQAPPQWAPEPAPPPHECRRTGHTAKELCRQMCSQSNVRQCVKLTSFIKGWIQGGMHTEPVRTHPLPVEYLHHYGTIDCLFPDDPRQVRYNGRWTFDPRNRNYAKAFHLAWPTLCEDRNANTLGNVLESLLGVRNARVWYSEPHVPVIDQVCEFVSVYINTVYQFTQWTGTEEDDIQVWIAYVHGLLSD